jgi:hypothetical protein
VRDNWKVWAVFFLVTVLKIAVKWYFFTDPYQEAAMNGFIDYMAYRLTAESNPVEKPLPLSRGFSFVHAAPATA